MARKNRVTIEFSSDELGVMERALIWADSYLWALYHEQKDESLRRLSKDFNKLKDDLSNIGKPLFDKKQKLLKERDERNTKRFWRNLGITVK